MFMYEEKIMLSNDYVIQEPQWQKKGSWKLTQDLYQQKTQNTSVEIY